MASPCRSECPWRKPATHGKLAQQSAGQAELDGVARKKTVYPRPRKRSVTIRLDEDTVLYFLELADETWIPYQTLINLYLRECAAEQQADRPSLAPQAAEDPGRTRRAASPTPRSPIVPGHPTDGSVLFWPASL